jgi:hypothetical protein
MILAPPVYPASEFVLVADPLLLAIAKRALRHAVDSAVPGATFIPFLFWYDDLGWRVFRFMTSVSEAATATEAEVSAANKARMLAASVDACAYVYDGHIKVAGVRHDAAYCRVSRRGADDGLRIAQPYMVAERGGTPIGAPHVLETVESWLP